MAISQAAGRGAPFSRRQTELELARGTTNRGSASTSEVHSCLSIRGGSVFQEKKRASFDPRQFNFSTARSMYPRALPRGRFTTGGQAATPYRIKAENENRRGRFRATGPHSDLNSALHERLHQIGGVVYQNPGEIPPAAGDYEQAIRLNPTAPDATTKLGPSLQADGPNPLQRPMAAFPKRPLRLKQKANRPSRRPSDK